MGTLVKGCFDEEDVAPVNHTNLLAAEDNPWPNSPQVLCLGTGNDVSDSSPALDVRHYCRRESEILQDDLVPESRTGDIWTALEAEVVSTMQRGGPGRASNCWTPAPASVFPIRGKTYLEDSKKVTPAEPHFKLIGVDTFTIETAQSNIALWRDGVFQQIRRISARTGNACPRVLIVNWLVPESPQQINHVQYYVERPFVPVTADDQMFKKMLDHFMAEVD